MAKATALQQNTQEVEPGVVIYTRGDHHKARWQVRIKLDNGPGYIRKTTGCADQQSARVAAIRIAAEIRTEQRLGYNRQSARFREFAGLYRIYLKERVKLGEITEDKLRVYEGTLDRYLIPYFGDKKIGMIKKSDVDLYHDYRKKHAKLKPPKGNTIRMEDSVLRGLFKFAVLKGALRQGEVPLIESPSKLSDRRPGFTQAEWKKLTTHLRKWPDLTEHPRVKRERTWLRDYVLFMANSGLRPSEARNLRWRDIEKIKTTDGQEGLRLWVSGKGKRGSTIPTEQAKAYLDRIKTYSKHIQPDDYVFCHDEDGTPVKTFGVGFEHFLKSCGLLQDGYGEKRTIYSLRHTYAQFRIDLADVSVWDLASNMRTSVAMIEKHYVVANVLGKASVLMSVKKAPKDKTINMAKPAKP